MSKIGDGPEVDEAQGVGEEIDIEKVMGSVETTSKDVGGIDVGEAVVVGARNEATGRNTNMVLYIVLAVLVLGVMGVMQYVVREYAGGGLNGVVCVRRASVLAPEVTIEFSRRHFTLRETGRMELDSPTLMQFMPHQPDRAGRYGVNRSGGSTIVTLRDDGGRESWAFLTGSGLMFGGGIGGEVPPGVLVEGFFDCH